MPWYDAIALLMLSALWLAAWITGSNRLNWALAIAATAFLAGRIIPASL